VAAANGRQLVDVRAGEIRERFRLEVTPHVFDGIQLGRVGREMAVGRRDARNEISDVDRAVRIGSIPHERHRRAQMAIELFGKDEHGVRIEVRLDEQLKIQTDGAPLWTDAQRGDHRDFPAVAADVPQDRGLSSGTPRAAHHGQQEQAAFIDEDQPRVQAVGFFLMRGQSCLTQRRIPSSSRSQARRMGRCGVQPSDRSNRPM
jgi:hypothetical protein